MVSFHQELVNIALFSRYYKAQLEINKNDFFEFYFIERSFDLLQ
jgi:hypothetical protein